jgi:hypothetical protein
MPGVRARIDTIKMQLAEFIKKVKRYRYAVATAFIFCSSPILISVIIGFFIFGERRNGALCMSEAGESIVLISILAGLITSIPTYVFLKRKYLIYCHECKKQLLDVDLKTIIAAGNCPYCGMAIIEPNLLAGNPWC